MCVGLGNRGNGNEDEDSKKKDSSGQFFFVILFLDHLCNHMKWPFLEFYFAFCSFSVFDFDHPIFETTKEYKRYYLTNSSANDIESTSRIIFLQKDDDI